MFFFSNGKETKFSEIFQIHSIWIPWVFFACPKYERIRSENRWNVTFTKGHTFFSSIIENYILKPYANRSWFHKFIFNSNIICYWNKLIKIYYLNCKLLSSLSLFESKKYVLQISRKTFYFNKFANCMQNTFLVYLDS
jgi:hypothetical protein